MRPAICCAAVIAAACTWAIPRLLHAPWPPGPGLTAAIAALAALVTPVAWRMTADLNHQEHTP